MSTFSFASSTQTAVEGKSIKLRHLVVCQAKTFPNVKDKSTNIKQRESINREKKTGERWKPNISNPLKEKHDGPEKGFLSGVVRL